MTTSLEEADNSQTHEEYPTATFMEDGDVVIVGGARTPFCEWLGGKRGDGGKGGRLSSISAEELGSIAIKGALEKTGTEPSEVDHVVMDTLFRPLIRLFLVLVGQDYCPEYPNKCPCSLSIDSVGVAHNQ